MLLFAFYFWSHRDQLLRAQKESWANSQIRAANVASSVSTNLQSRCKGEVTEISCRYLPPRTRLTAFFFGL